MYESYLAVPFHFAVEFLGFLVMAGAAVLVLARAQLIPGGTARRVTAGVGFGLFAVVQLVHGAAFVDADGEAWLVAVRGSALLLVAIALGAPGGMVAPGFAAIVRERPWSLLPAVGGLLLALAALGRRSRLGRPAYRLAAAGLAFAVSEVLIAGSPNARVGMGAVSSLSYAGHAARFVGFIAVGAWVWSVVRSSIRTRFVAAFAALLVAVVLALSTSLTAIITTNVQDEELKRVSTQLQSALGNIREAVRTVTRNVEIVGDSAIVRQSVAGRANLDALTRQFVVRETFDFDFALFTTASGELLASFGRPQIGDRGQPVPRERAEVVSILGSDVLKDVTGASPVAASIDRLDEDTIAMLAAADVVDPVNPNRVAGVLAAGRYLDARATEQISAEFTPAQATIVAGRQVVASELPSELPRDGLVSDEVRAELAMDGSATIAQSIGSQPFFSAFAPLETESGVRVATVVLSTPARVVTATRTAVTRSLFLVALAAGLLAVLLAYVSGRRISRPIRELTRAATAVREGDLTVTAPVAGTDEVGRLGETFNEMTASLLSMTGDLRRAAHEEQDLRARIETIIQSMADGLVAVDASQSILAFNPQAEALTGIEAADAIGKPLQEILDVCDAQGEHVALPIDSLSEGSVTGVYLMGWSGAPVPVAITSAVLRGDQGEVSGGVAVIRDVSREFEIEKIKSEFLSNISHELRTPLTPIKGFAELLERTEVPAEKAHQFASGILKSTARLERIVNLLVDFSALEAGKLAPHTAAVDIGSLAGDLARSWDERTTAHTVVATVFPGLPPVFGDERLLRRSLEEVLDNAVKFSPHGGTIALQATRGGGNGRDSDRAVVVRISDEGIGISPEDLSKVFYDFHQLDGSETRTFGGLGLGLAFVQRIVEAHNGRVSVESEVDSGTTVTITLPAGPGLVGIDRNEETAGVSEKPRT